MISPAELERLRRKVEAGDVLSGAELDALRAEAARSPGPTLRLTVAHALVNADAEREALPWMQSLRRDFPKDLQVRLGLARALLGLERHREAEVELRDALVLSPGDPEALKVLAVLALRQGEGARARAYVAEAVERDPFDAEAKLLRAELEAADLPPPPAPEEQVLRPEFTAALTAALGRAGVGFRRQGRDLLVKLFSGGVGRVDVGSLYAAYREAPGAHGLTAHVEALAARLGGLSSGVSLDALRPVLRPAGFVAGAQGALLRPGPAGLEVFYVLEDAEFARYLPASALGEAGLTPEAVDAAAWHHLEARPADVRPVVIDQGEVRLAEAFSGVWAVMGGDGHDGARLLTKAQRRRLDDATGGGPLRVSLGRREMALLCRDSDSDSVRRLASLGHAPDGVPGLYVLDGDTLRVA
ncbi:tetratricopeptide repeat protein [Corallococcus sp. Z5C101001]|uniref:tetratricopeptide repeat protein n=1 Tax=Corallococcus sp. Z5C101001 TaxID=2596829 RepID=UPI00117E4803|nr:tetratricopeptide repeat protein [Corallococcus sp. Z5C101001]TSC29299.1 tetratricopeptide repeat protein [Corallococcus sp. Z5C101001]